jgi:hypothetical protein
VASNSRDRFADVGERSELRGEKDGGDRQNFQDRSLREDVLPLSERDGCPTRGLRKEAVGAKCGNHTDRSYEDKHGPPRSDSSNQCSERNTEHRGQTQADIDQRQRPATFV